MTSSDSDLKDILAELKHLSLKRKQLMERRTIQSIFQEMRNRVEFGQTEEAALNLHEIDNIDEKLKQLTERKAELQILYDNILNAKDMTNDKKAESQDAEDMTNDKKAESQDAEDMTNDKKAESQDAKDMKNGKKAESKFTGSIISSRQIVPDVPDPRSDIFYVKGPPNIPAPTVILDVETLPACSCRTQCPECKEFIMTETSTSISSVTWMVCFILASFGCVAGCCLIPFCMDKFKSITHTCPRCRTPIMTIKKL
ncbi:hypothetical protein VZT92_007166 [Zoarces viviparus]|uniref:LITAF domain-containing protein n=1 Tax=Zoarces viviparus TaxID=48416 RepID=A0AAW1FJ01_ZOAVI